MAQDSGSASLPPNPTAEGASPAPAVILEKEDGPPKLAFPQILSPLMPHHKSSGAKGSTGSLLFPPSLSPALSRQRSKSNDEMNLAGLIPDPLAPVAASIR